jgi:hypothetical protein
MEYHCYRGTQHIATLTIPGDARASVTLSHRRHMQMPVTGRTDDLSEMTLAQEVFEWDPVAGRYVNHHPERLPAWLIRQELDELTRESDKARADYVRRLYE